MPDVSVKLKFDVDSATLNQAIERAKQQFQSNVQKEIDRTQVTERSELRARMQFVGSDDHLRLLREQLDNQKMAVQLQRQQQFAEWRAQYGTIGAGVMRANQMKDSIEAGLRSALGGISSTFAMLGIGTSMGALASAAGPAVSETLTGSLRLAAGEIGIILIPQIVAWAEWLQRGAHYIRSFSSETVGAIRSVIFWGTTIAASGWVLARFVGGLKIATTMLTTMGASQGLAGALTKTAAAAGLVVAGFSALTMYLNYQRSQAISTIQRADAISNGAGATTDDLSTLPPGLRLQLQNARTREERRRIAQQSVNPVSPLEMQWAQQQQNTGVFQYGVRRWQQDMGAFSNSFFGYLARGMATIAAPIRYGIDYYSQSNAMQNIGNQMQNNAVLQQIAQTGVLPNPEMDRARNAFRMAFSVGGFQSQQIGLENLHSMVQTSAIRDPMQEQIWQQQQRAFETFMQIVGNPNSGVTLSDFLTTAGNFLAGGGNN